MENKTTQDDRNSISHIGQNTMVIFDWDDTLLEIGDHLVESQYQACEYMKEQSQQYTFANHWEYPSKSTLKKHIGQRFRETIVPTIFPDLDIHNALQKKWLDELVCCFRKLYSKTSKKMYRGAYPMLQHLKESGYRLAIATNKSRDLLEIELKDNQVDDSFFSYIICADDEVVEKLYKPHPRMIDTIQKSSPEFVYYVMVGDRDSDIVAAKNSLKASQTKTIAITTTQQAFSAKPDRYLKMASRITDNLLKELLKGLQVK